MELLKERIRKDGVVKEGNVLKVDRFLNHQMDVKLFREIGKEFKKRFEGEDINKILTIEASGIVFLSHTHEVYSNHYTVCMFYCISINNICPPL